jgi:hypothetical protein
MHAHLLLYVRAHPSDDANVQGPGGIRNVEVKEKQKLLPCLGGLQMQSTS